MPEEMQNFFQGFNIDTLLAVISCITGIVALFLGGSAYKKCQRNSFNDKKEFGDNGNDNSMKAGGNIIVNTCDTNALAGISCENFQVTLNKAYEMFERKTEENLHKIIDEAGRILKNKKMELGSYTKVDWINVYFENAKNFSNEYMQSIWAKVLVQELSNPNSFSMKTIDVLKNMTEEEFKLFEKMCSFVIDNFLPWSDNDSFSWIDKVKMQEFGLLTLEYTKRSNTIESNSTLLLLIHKDYVLKLYNPDDIQTINFEICLLTNSATELLKIYDYKLNREYINKFVDHLKSKISSKIIISLHKTVRIDGSKVEYYKENILEKT